MSKSHEKQLAKQVVKEFRRRFGEEVQAGLLMSPTVMEAMVAKEVMLVCMSQEDHIRYRGRDMAERSEYSTIYREACQMLFSWWKPETE